MATILISYQSPRPKADPHKLPRPHRVELDEKGRPVAATGGEIGETGNLIGLSPTVRPDFGRMVLGRSLASLDEGELEKLVGWYAQFAGEGGTRPFSYPVKIRRVEILP